MKTSEKIHPSSEAIGQSPIGSGAIGDRREGGQKIRGGLHPLSKKELAMMYAPNLSIQGARKRLKAWLHMNTELMDELYRNHYCDSQRVLTAKQVEIIFSYLGEP